LQEDFGETLLPVVLGRFARAHPKARIEARIARNIELIDRVTTGRLDLALTWSDGAAIPFSERLAEVPMRWIGPTKSEDAWRPGSDEPLPLAARGALPSPLGGDEGAGSRRRPLADRLREPESRRPMGGDRGGARRGAAH
jgi:DNA-binding transcriptional LysR family regulator